MELTWGIAAIWLGLALVASLLSIRFKMSVALVEIMVGVVAGNRGPCSWSTTTSSPLAGSLKANPWIAFLAGFGVILLDVHGRHGDRAGCDAAVFQGKMMAIGLVGFAGPFVGGTTLCAVCQWLGLERGADIRGSGSPPRRWPWSTRSWWRPA